MRAQRATGARAAVADRHVAKNVDRVTIARLGGSTVGRKPGCRVAPRKGDSLMQIIPITLEPAADLDRLGDEIAELSAHLDAATARLLDLIREFDARDGWNTGFRSCAA